MPALPAAAWLWHEGGGGEDGGREIDSVAVVELANAGDDFANDFFPFVGGGGGDDFLEGGGEFAAALPGLLGGARPGPVDFVLGGVHFLKTGGGNSLREFLLRRKTKNMRRVWGRRGNIHVFQEGPDHQAKEWVFVERTPGDERNAAAGFEHAAHFAQGFLDVGNKHDAEAAGDAIEEATGERELLGIGGAKVDVGETARGGIFLSDFEHFEQQISGDD